MGKTTVLYQTVRNLLANGLRPGRVWFLELDHPVLRQERLDLLVNAVMHLSNASHESPAYLMLDELVYAQDWDLWLKTFYDQRYPVRIAATSSAAATLQTRRMESGVGRWLEQHMGPYQLSEWAELAGVATEVEPSGCLAETLRTVRSGASADPQLKDLRSLLMLTGGFPELLTRTARAGEETSLEDQALLSQDVLRGDVIRRAIYQDILLTYPVDHPPILEKLLYVLADQIGGIVSPANLASELGVAANTVTRYLSYLESTFLIFTLPAFASGETAKQRRGRKLYFTDCAVRNAALVRGAYWYDSPREAGHVLENLAAASLQTLSEHSGCRLYYWRDRRHNEVDFVYDDPRGRLAFEIGSSPNHSRRGLFAFLAARPEFRENAYLVAPNCTVTQADESEDGIGTLPLDTFLLAVGKQSDREMANRLGMRLGG